MLRLQLPWAKLFIVFLVCGLLSLAGYSSYQHLQALFYDRLELSLRSQVGTLHQSLTAWGRSKRSYVYSWARQPEVRRTVEVLASTDAVSVAKLARYRLDDFLRPVLSDPEIQHYYLIAGDRNVIATSNTERLGWPSPVSAFPHLQQQAWSGGSVASPPAFLSGAAGKTTILLASAVKDAQSRVVGVLVLEVDPLVGFNQVFKKTSYHETGEAYAFNPDGRLLTPVRSRAEGGRSAGGVDVPAHLVETLRSGQENFLNGRAYAVHARAPYVGHDGILKVGAWVWDPQFQIGVAMQQDAKEGLTLLENIRWVFISFVCLVLSISLGFFFYLNYWSAARTKKEIYARKLLKQELTELHQSKTLDIADREAKYRATIDAVWDAILTVDEHGIALSCNPAALRIFSCREQDIVGRPIDDRVVVPGVGAFSAEYLSSVLGQEVEAVGILAGDTTFSATLSAAVTHTSTSFFYTVVIRDISRQKASEQSLLETQQRLEMSQAFAFIGTWEWDLKSDRVLATEMAMKLMGLHHVGREVGLVTFLAKVKPEDRSGLNHAVHKSISSQLPFTMECQISPDGFSSEWLLIAGTPIIDQGGVARVVGHVQRISDRKFDEQKLKDARKMLQLVIDTIPIGVYWKTPDMTIAGVNKKFCQDIGLDKKDIIGKKDYDIYCNQDQAHMIERLDSWVAESGVPVESETGRYHMNNGAERQIEISRLPIKDSNKKAFGVLGVYTDITDRLETQHNLYRHHRLLSSIYSSQLRYFDDSREELFAYLLQEVLTLGESEYGFIGRIMHDEANNPYLKTYSITDIAWDTATKELYEATKNQGMEFHNLETLFGHTIKTGEIVISNCPAEDDRAKGLPKGHPDMSAFLGIPLFKGSHLVGMIGIANRPGGYDSELISFLQPMFTTCGNLIAAIESEAEILATQKQLRRAKDAAEKASHAKTEFLSRVSHELRTPMNAIIGFATLLSEAELNTEYQSFLKEIHTAGDHLMNLINEVLDLERIESGRIELKLEWVDLGLLIDECCAVLQPMAEEKRVSLSSQAMPAVRSACFCDRGRIKQVLLNLLSNAIKYNKDGGAVVINADYSEDVLIVDVEDTGVGLSESEQAQLFESFNRLHAQNSNIDGVGMGLVITRQLVELMGGTLEVVSRKGVGSHFIIRLPLKRTSDAEERAVEKSVNNPLVLGNGILGLIDERAVMECHGSVQELLSSASALFVDSGIQFLERALQGRYDLLVIEASVCDLPTEELVQYLNDADVLGRTPLLILCEHRQQPCIDTLPDNVKRGLYLQSKSEPLSSPLLKKLGFNDQNQN